jgi:hypothetical protein
VTWQKAGPCAMSNGRFTICRAPQEGFVRDGQRITYTLTSGNEVVDTMFADNTQESRLEAVSRLKRRAEEMQ